MAALFAGARMNNGENQVFPIQVSLQELFLFLGVVIVSALIKPQDCGSSVREKRKNCTEGKAATGQAQSRAQRNSGEVNFPIQVHSENIIVIAAAIIFIFRTTLNNARAVPEIK